MCAARAPAYEPYDGRVRRSVEHRLKTLARGYTNTIVYPRRVWRCKVLIDVLEPDVAHEIRRVLKCLLVV